MLFTNYVESVRIYKFVRPKSNMRPSRKRAGICGAVIGDASLLISLGNYKDQGHSYDTPSHIRQNQVSVIRVIHVPFQYLFILLTFLKFTIVIFLRDQPIS